MPDGNGTGRTPGFVARLSKDDAPASPFSSSEKLIAGSSSLAVGFFGLLSFEADVPTLCGEIVKVWEGE